MLSFLFTLPSKNTERDSDGLRTVPSITISVVWEFNPGHLSSLGTISSPGKMETVDKTDQAWEEVRHLA